MLGKIIIGNENSAGNLSMTGAPTVTSLSDQLALRLRLPPAHGCGHRPSGRPLVSPEVAGNNDVQRITYFTPSFNGLDRRCVLRCGEFYQRG